MRAYHKGAYEDDKSRNGYGHLLKKKGKGINVMNNK